MEEKTKFRVGLNGEPGNLDAILTEFGSEIYEVFAPAPPDVCPTGRSGSIHPTMDTIATQIQKAHDYNVRYNVLLNGSCFGGRQYTEAFRQKIIAFIDAITDNGADSVTVVDPFLIRLIRSHSDIDIIVGQFADVHEYMKALRFEALGVSGIVIHSNAVRNFSMLKTMQKKVDARLEFIVNGGELYQCECFQSHSNMVSHASVLSEEEKKELGNYDCFLKGCRKARQIDPIEFLMCSFIRPEDLHVYEAMGFRIFKLAGRKSPTEFMLNVLRAYSSRSYTGNILTISHHFGYTGKIISIPNDALEGWLEETGGYEDEDFREKCIAFYKKRKLERYFNLPGTKRY